MFNLLCYYLLWQVMWWYWKFRSWVSYGSCNLQTQWLPALIACMYFNAFSLPSGHMIANHWLCMLHNPQYSKLHFLNFMFIKSLYVLLDHDVAGDITVIWFLVFLSLHKAVCRFVSNMCKCMRAFTLRFPLLRTCRSLISCSIYEDDKKLLFSHSTLLNDVHVCNLVQWWTCRF